ncbi:pituitary adenylate cyclase-activating polypeptide isoform X3 [Manacus candei]|uniref:pituitary adenylate cyclase-activating polypeptide isoform X3 n=1 Tax=Manacus candei TaxID=415023 RepID=UPI002225F25C|nr:pituitary adenylate cyclase-activating polypeptide isoform X3 [Manacus candei]
MGGGVGLGHTQNWRDLKVQSHRSTKNKRRSPPRPGGRCEEEWGEAPGPGGEAGAHRPVSAAEAARLPPSPWHTNALEDEVYDEDGNTLQDFAYDHEPLGIANPSSMIGEMYTLYYPPEKRHADGIFNKAYRKLLGQLSARKYLHSLMAKRVGGASGGLGDEAEPLTKRHIDGIFTDSYSRYRKQMAVKKYLAAVLGKRYKQRVKNKGRRVAYL